MYKTALLLFFLMVGLDAASQLPPNEAYIALAGKQACAASEKEAIVKADTLLEETTGIHSTHLYSKNIYIRHPKNSKNEFCVEGVVTKKGFDLYTAQLAEEYESIMGEIEDLNDGVRYTQKQKEVERLYNDVIRFNGKIAMAEKLAPLQVEKIDETQSSLSKTINAIPVVKFTVNGCNGTYMTGCRLVFVSSFKDDSSSVFYRWDFGDGSHSRRTNPIHSYKKAGTYKVSLRITDEGQKQASVTQELHIAAQPESKIMHKPNASFSTQSKVYETGESIEFIDLSSSKGSKVVAYRWTFGDGGTSTLHHPKYFYEKTGSYDVHLEITNSDGLKSETVETVQIVHPAILFSVNGQYFKRVVRKFGDPQESIEKEGVLTQAYKYGSDWLLVKQNQVECRIKGTAFKTNLMGNPKNCHWYEKHAASAMYVFDE